MNRPTITIIRCCLFCIIFLNVTLSNAQDTIRLYFHLNEPTLTARASSLIDSLVYNRIIQDRKKMTIVGYADYLGSKTHNKTLSKKRAVNVKEYLINLGLNTENILLCMGKGEVPRDNEVPEGFAPDRRVDIVLNTPQPISTKRPSTQLIQVKQTEDLNILAKQLNDVVVGNTFVLNNIYFYPGRHTVRTSSLEPLEQLFDALNQNPNIHIQIEGHVCCVKATAPDALDEGTFELALSVNRAKAIYHYLIAEGIEKNRLRYVGFGKRRPVVAIEKTPEDANKNRRVEIRVLKK